MEVAKEQSIFKNNTYMRMFTAYFISIFGDWFDMIAIIVLISYTWNTDPMLIGLIPVAFALPGILFGSVAGVLADRWRKLNIMIFADLTSAILTTCLFFASNIYWVLPILMLRSTVGLLNSPAQQALTRNVVDEKLLLKATSMNQLVNQLAKVIGPLLGAALLTIVSPLLCILINAISSFLSAMILLTLRNIKENQQIKMETSKRPTFRESWLEGWGFTFKNKLIFNSLIFGFIGLLVIQMIDIQFPVLFRKILPGNPSVIGWLVATTGLGAILSMTIINKLKTFKYGWVLGGGCFLMGVGFCSLGFLPVGVSIVWPSILGLIIGFGNGMWMVSYNYILQTESTKEMVGRVFGINNSLSSVAVIIAPISGGALIKLFGPSEIYQLIGIGIAIVGLGGILFQKWLWSTKKPNQQPFAVVSEA
jgi:MFS transporter, DHA3 family, macrolide efflux protein